MNPHHEALSVLVAARRAEELDEAVWLAAGIRTVSLRARMHITVRA